MKEATEDRYNIPITEKQIKGGAEWVKAHKGTDIVDTPLWVLISLGVQAIQAESEDKLDGNPVDIDKAVEHYEGTLETLKGIDLEVDG